MSSWEKNYNKWSTYEALDPQLKEALVKQSEDTELLEDAFYQELTFGTGGMRGILGPGTNRMNIYTVRKAIDGLAHYLLENGVNVKDRGVVVAYDSRYMSKEFAIEAAKVLGFYGIRTYVFARLRPTPLLSFAVRHLGTVAGIMITASHNPPEYNGFKIYNEDGGQITLEEANDIITYVQKMKDGLQTDVLTEEELEEKQLFQWLGKEVDDAYLEQLKTITRMNPEEIKEEKDLSIVFTPLHGTAYHLVTEGLQQLTFEKVFVVEEQATPDPEFSTVESPNPEEAQAFQLAIAEGRKHNADLLLATDPDADRLGAAVKDQAGEYQLLTGNQLGALILDYLLMHSDPALLGNSRMLKTIVTSELGRAIASSYGVRTIDTLTGFKFIGEKIREYDATGENFIFGYEESYGYLISSFARDKDAVQAAVIASEMAHYWKEKGKTLIDALHGLYEKHGYYLEGLTSLTLDGIEGSRKIVSIMDHVRHGEIKEMGGLAVQQVEDYLSSERRDVQTNEAVEAIDLPKENVVKFILENESWACFRPSGTEPKLKCYYGVRGEQAEESKEQLAKLQGAMEQLIQQVIE